MTANATRPSRIVILLSSVWLIAAAAFITRLGFVWDQQRKIPHQVLASVPFEQETGNIALALAQGNGFSDLFRKPTGPTAWLAPVYPFLLSLIFRLFGALTIRSFFAAVILNALFSAAATFPLFAMARRLAGVGIAAFTCWAWGFLPAGVLMPFEWIWDTSLSVLLALTVLWLTLRLAERSDRGSWPGYGWIGYGLLWALALLTNPALAIGLPFLLGWAMYRAPRGSLVSWRSTALSLAIIALCCLPWTVRNYRHFHRVIPLRSSLPFELWIGNNDIFDPQAIHGIQRITRYEETRRYAQLGENAYLDEKRDSALSFIREKPVLFLRLTLRRVLATWAGTEHPYEDFRRTDSLLARSILIVNLFLTLGTAAGLALLFVRGVRFAFPIAVLPLLFPVTYYVTHASLRYRHPIDPVLLLLTVFAGACCFRSRAISASAPAPAPRSLHS